MNHPIIQTIQDMVNAGTGSLVTPNSDHLTDYVEWVVAHKGCGKPCTGMSPMNGWCKCPFVLGSPMVVTPELGLGSDRREQPVVQVPVDQSLLTRCEAAEKEVAKLTEKLDKASKRIAELVKKT